MSQQHSVRADSDRPSRREFLRRSTGAAVGAAVVGSLDITRSAHAAGSDVLKIGLVGCGGRGTGAALDALAADKYSKLVAVADLFPDRLEAGLRNILAGAGEEDLQGRIDVPPEQRFSGFDGYQKLLATGVDVVLLCTPPHFRPAHLKAAVEAGKHVFCEKPVAVDAPGLRSVLASSAEAKRKNLTLVSGLCYRYDPPKREVIGRILDGAVGRVLAVQTNYNTGFLWSNPREPAWSDMEFQLRNWLYYTWLSGDFNVEQHIHSLDKARWVLGDQVPARATGLGGRQVRTEPLFGNAFDHMAVVYEFAGGARVFSYCRQIGHCANDTSDHVLGTAGTAELMRAEIKGDKPFKYSGPTPSMYRAEHQALFAALRAGNPIHNGQYMCDSTLMAIMGRMACYTGQTLTWEQCLNSQENLSPPKYEFGPLPTPAVARPGSTPFV